WNHAAHAAVAGFRELPARSVACGQPPFDQPWAGIRQHTFEELEESLRGMLAIGFDVGSARTANPRPRSWPGASIDLIAAVSARTQRGSRLQDCRRYQVRFLRKRKRREHSAGA